VTLRAPGGRPPFGHVARIAIAAVATVVALSQVRGRRASTASSPAAARAPRAVALRARRRIPGASLLRAPGRLYRSGIVRGRWVVLLAWAALAIVVFTLLPNGHAVGGDAGFSNLLPADSPALQVEQRALSSFRVPVLSGTTVVVHAKDGLTLRTRVLVALKAYEATKRTIAQGPSTRPGSIIAAVPVPLVADDVAVNYLFLSPGTGIWKTSSLANAYARQMRAAIEQPGVDVSVTGFVPAQVSQGEQLAAALPLFELASLVIILLITSITFRSLLAPVLILVTGATGYLIFYRVLSGTAGQFGLSVPQQLEPVLAALFIGVITDYCVLLFSSFRDALTRGEDQFTAARSALADDGPVIAVAGITVAGGIIALLVSPFAFFRALGPSLAVTVVSAVLVALTLAPALMTLVGSRLFSLRGASHLRAHAALRGDDGGRAHRVAVAAVRALTLRRVAAIAVLVSVGALAVAAAPVLHARLSLSFTAGLPADDPVQRSAQLLSSAGIRGITAPTEVLVEGNGVADAQRVQLVALQVLLAQQPGVARVIGPGDNPLRANIGVVYSASGDAARYIVVLDSDPLGARAVADLRALQRALPRLASTAQLRDVRVEVTGQTRIASEVAGLTVESLRDTLIAAFVIELLILVLYLRSLLAPVMVLLAGLLSVGAASGLTVLLFQDRLGQPGLTFYAPFSTAILLLALGADYTVFTVGAIWRQAREAPLRSAIVSTLPRTARTVTAAGIILASTFASVAFVPLTAFQQIAFTMAVGLLLDTLVVRPILTPALLALLGRSSQWPGPSVRADGRPSARAVLRSESPAQRRVRRTRSG
jgi:RND superfamily putative drug exporter